MNDDNDGGKRRRWSKKRDLADPDYEFWDYHRKPKQIEELEKASRRALRGRDAVVFESQVLAPLRGEHKQSVAELAADLGVSADRIYRIEYDAKQKVRRAVCRDYGEPAKPDVLMAYIEGVFSNEMCSVCGRAFRWRDLALCNGIYGDNLFPRPECLRAWSRAQELNRVMAAYKSEYAAWRKARSEHSSTFEHVAELELIYEDLRAVCRAFGARRIPVMQNNFAQ